MVMVAMVVVMVVMVATADIVAGATMVVNNQTGGLVLSRIMVKKA
jgi:hypothetical protein